MIEGPPTTLTNRPDPMYRSAPSLTPVTFPEQHEPPDLDDPAEPAEPVESLLDTGSWRPSGLLEWFAISQTALPALLYLPGNQPFRSAIRASAFLVSILAFAFWVFGQRPRFPVRHPAQPWLLCALFVLAAMMVHPDTHSVFAGVGQTALYFAVFSPVFWVPAFVDSRRTLIRVLAILLICNGINSVVGVLQVYDADRWMPGEYSRAFTLSREMLATTTYIGPNGRVIVRPPGLFDTPGAVCGAGTVAALLGLIFCLEKIAWWKRAVALGMAMAGMAAIYLSHVRASFLVAMVMMAAYMVMLAVQKQKTRLTSFLALAAAIMVIALSVATMLGGETVQERFTSVFAGDPRQVYYESRGSQLENAFYELLPTYPFGAGLGRWGVMAGFADVPRSKQMWVEVQLGAWILDGGLFLAILYGGALIATLVWELKLVFGLPDQGDRLWASALVAANIGTLAFVLTFVPFSTQIGLQFWFLEGLLHGAMATKRYQWA